MKIFSHSHIGINCWYYNCNLPELVDGWKDNVIGLAGIEIKQFMYFMFKEFVYATI